MVRQDEGTALGAAAHYSTVCGCTAALLFNNFPSFAEGFFWYSSEATYVLPAVALFGLLLYSALILLLLPGEGLRQPMCVLLHAFMLPLIIVMLVCFPAYMALGAAPPLRVMNMAYTFFVLGWLIFLLQLRGYLHAAFVEDGADKVFFRQVFIITAIVGLLASINTHDLRRANLFLISKSLVRRIPQGYDAEMQANYARIIAAKDDTVRLPPLQYAQGNLLFTTEMVPRPTVTGLQYGRY